jgi:phosphoglycolate phosphatase-like HAD superfamily hydrolase
MRLCVFDLDHTLIRSPLDLAAMALDMRGHLEGRWRPLAVRPERYRVGELIALCQTEAPHLERDLWSIALDHERKAVEDASLEPGALEAVSGARAAGFNTALWTNNAREVTLDALCRFGLDELLDIIVTRDDMRQLKPDADGWRVICEITTGALRRPVEALRPVEAPPGARPIEERHGSPGTLRTSGGLGGPVEAPPGARPIEERHGSPGTLRTSGGLGGPVEAPQSVVVGDSWVDGAAARAAGVPFIAYRTNPRDLERWKVTPVATLMHLGDLPALLAGLRESG